MTDKILKGFDEGLLTGIILIDLQKAFNTINHEILFKKLKAMGFSQGCITWFQSYGPILGHLLFLIYVNDMPQAVNSNLFLYADDSCLMFQHKEVEEIERVLNNDFENICDWFVDNKLSIHFGEDKTKSILFASQRKIKTIKKLNIKYQDIEIKQHLQVTYLGCVMDETMSGEPRGTLNLMQSLKNLQITQNKCVRFCVKLDKMHHISEEDFKTINWLPVDQRV